MPTDRGSHGRYATAFSDHDLLRIVGDVAHAIQPEATQRLSTRAFNAGRERVAERWPGAPTASAILQRLNSGGQATVTWSMIVESALGSEVMQRQTLVTGSRSEAMLDDRAVFAAVRLADRNTDRRLNSDEYARVRDRLLTERSSHQREVMAGLLPTAYQLTFYAGTWSRVLEIAQLAAAESADGPIEERRLVRTPIRQRSLPIAEAIYWFARLPEPRFLRRGDDRAVE